jgi:hypothetical protein
MCNAGYAGDGFLCRDPTVCNEQESANCDEKAQCIPPPRVKGKPVGPPTCKCKAGYTGPGSSSMGTPGCVVVNLCMYNNGGCDDVAGVCKMIGVGQVQCAGCKKGYKGDGKTCVERNGCDENGGNGGCHTQAACFDLGLGERQCDCNAARGYAGNGTHCAEVNPCEENHGNCDPLATCTKIDGNSRSCACNAGYSGSGVSCELDDPCTDRARNPCHVDAVCNTMVRAPSQSIVGAKTSRSVPSAPSCTCNSGFRGNGITLCQPYDGHTAPVPEAFKRVCSGGPVQTGSKVVLDCGANYKIMGTLFASYGKPVRDIRNAFHITKDTMPAGSFLQIVNTGDAAKGSLGALAYDEKGLIRQVLSRPDERRCERHPAMSD